MNHEWAELLPAAARESQEGPPGPPRDVLQRLELVAALLRAAPGAGDRLLWRDEAGAVRVRVLDGAVVIGRAADCDVRLASNRVSRRHCVIRPAAGAHEIEDLGSMNGTLVNGRRVQRQVLHDGDVIELGGWAAAYCNMVPPEGTGVQVARGPRKI